MILFCGDPHGYFGHIIEAVQEHKPAAVILLGDLQAQNPLGIELASILDETEIWFIHDTGLKTDHDHLLGSKLADRNLHGQVVEIAGLRIAGFGGVQGDYEGLKNQRADILVTHEAPSAHRHGFAIDDLARRLGVTTSFNAVEVGFRGIIDQDGQPKTPNVIWKSLFGTSPE